MTGELGLHFLQPFLERVSRKRAGVKSKTGPRWADGPLTDERVAKHLNGGPVFGACPIAPGESTTRLAVLDLDSHRGETAPEHMRAIAVLLAGVLEMAGMHPLPFRSSGGHGLHLVLLWDTPQDARSVRKVLANVLTECGLRNGAGGLAANEVEIFPKQDRVPVGGWGNWVALPYGGESVPLDNDMAPLPRDTLAQIRASADVPLAPPEAPRAAPDAAEAMAALPDVADALAAVPNDEFDGPDYDRWFEMLCAIHQATGGSADGLALALEWSAKHPKFDAAVTEAKWNSIHDRPDGITAATLFARARECGYGAAVADDFPNLDAEEAGGVPDGAVAPSAVAAAAATKPERFRVYSVAEVQAWPHPRWLVDDLLPQQELAVIYGEPGSGKSFAAMDLALSVARGVPWLGRDARQGSVLYICAEGRGGLRKRLDAYQQQHGVDIGALPLGTIVDVPQFAGVTPDAGDIVRAMRRSGRGRLALTVVDTLAQTMAGGDENSGKDVGAVIAKCRYLQSKLGGLMLIVHHSGKDTTKGARGWSGLKGAVDAELEVTRSGAQRQIAVTKAKDGEDLARLGFKLVPITVGMDDAGRPVTSCIVQADDTPLRVPRRQQAPKPGSTPAMVLEIAADMAALASVPAFEIVDAAIVRMVPTLDNRGRDRRRGIAQRALESLAAGGFVECLNGEVSLVVEG